MACGSGLRAMISAYQSIAMGDREVVLAGGAESMSRVPYLLEVSDGAPGWDTRR